MSAPSQSLLVWLRSARSPFLNLLRNLTPQVFLASMAWIFARKLNFDQVVIANWPPTLGFYVFLAMFLYAFYANTTLFFEEAFADLNCWLKEQDQLLRQTSAGRSLNTQLLRILWRERKLETAIAVVVLLALEYLFAGVIASSLAATVRLVKLAHS